MPGYPLPKPGIWLRKKSTGRQRPLKYGSILLGVGIGSLLVCIVLMLIVSPLFLVPISVVSFPCLMFGTVFIHSFITRDYYFHFAMLMFEPEQVEFNDMRRFIERFLKEHRMEFDRRKKHDIEYKWYFRGRAGGFVTLIKGGEWTYAVAIRDRDGNLEDLVVSFINDICERYDIPKNEVWWKTFLD